MKGLTPSAPKARKQTCSFCKSPNHQVTVCPDVLPVWRSLEKGIIPLSLLQQLCNNSTHRYNPFRWFTQGSEWGNLYKHTEKAANKVVAYQERQRLKAAGKKKTKTAKEKSCGYCGERGHTRRTCGLLASDKTKLAKANRNFREWVYTDLVQTQGLSTGAIISFQATQPATYQQEAFTKTVTTLVTAVNWDSMNVFSTMDIPDTGWRNAQNHSLGQERLVNIAEFFKSYVLVKTARKPFDDADFNLNSRYGAASCSSIGTALPVWSDGERKQQVINWDTQDRIGYNAPLVTSYNIVSPAPQILSEDWKDGYMDQMSVVFKKFTRNELIAVGVLEHIISWQQARVS